MKEFVHLRITVFIITAITVGWVLSGCQKDIIEFGEADEVEVSGRAGSSVIPEGAFYDHDAECWLVPINDPYELSNVQLAFENLMNGTSPLITEDMDIGTLALPPRQDPRATHYHVRIMPTTMEQLTELYEMGDVELNNFPFDHNSFGLEETAGWPVPPTGSSRKRYWHYPEEPECVDGIELDEVDTEPFLLPVLYGIWPSSKRVPEGFKVNILHNLYLPATSSSGIAQSSSSGGISFDDLLIEEARRLAYGDDHPSPVSRAGDGESAAAAGSDNGEGQSTGSEDETGVSAASNTNYIRPSGYIRVWDNMIGRNIPVPNMHVRISEGSRVLGEAWTDEFGRFSRNDLSVSQGIVRYQLILQGKRNEWRITDFNGTRKDITCSGSKVPGTTYTFNMNPNMYMLHIHRALTTFWYTNHPFHKVLKSKEIIFEDRGGRSYFHNSKRNRSFIRIFTESPPSSFNIFGTVCHEMGHSLMANKKSYDDHSSAQKTLKESWASLVGWYFAKQEYERLGYYFMENGFYPNQSHPVYPWFCIDCEILTLDDYGRFIYRYEDFNFYHNAQHWNTSYTGEDLQYTPFFVDLVDDNNQRKAKWVSDYRLTHAELEQYPDDLISDVPVTLLQDLAIRYNKMAPIVTSVRNSLQDDTDRHHFDILMATYDQVWR